MHLSRMQDIGGCRAVLDKVEDVERLVKLYEDDGKKLRKYDYIANPKLDGYRSIHLRVECEGQEQYGRLIEIQIRTRLQHAWATALETCQTFTKQAGSNRKAEQHWLKFLCIDKQRCAANERCPFVSGTTSDSEERRRSIRDIIERHHIWEQFHLWNATLKKSSENAAAYLLELNVSTLELSITGFEKTETPRRNAIFESGKGN